MNFLMPNFITAVPELSVLFMASFALLAELFLGKKHTSLSYILVQIALIIALGLSYLQIGEYKDVTFSGLYISDDIATLLKIFIYISGFVSFFYARQYIDDRGIPKGEYYILGLFSILGMMVLVSAHSLLTIYLGLELMSLPLYAMIALKRQDSLASEAAMKYFVMGAIASGLILFGISMLYGATGSIDLSIIAERVAKSWPHQRLMVSFALVFIVTGVCFKLATAPFHMWAPDVYQGAPTSVTLFLSSAPKLAALGMAMRILIFTLPTAFEQWQQLLIIVSILSVGLGNLLAIAQKNIKRMLAYSGISHMGFVLFGLVTGTTDGYSAALFYVLVYSIMAIASFGLVVMMSNGGFEAENIEHYKGLNKRNPWLAFLMMIIMFSMAGVPPTVGFYAKLLVLKALVDANLAWIAVVGLLLAVVGAFYYLRVIKVMYFEPPSVDDKLNISNDLTLIFSLNALALLVLGFIPSMLIQACINAFSM